MFTQQELSIILEAFCNWLSNDDYDSKGRAKNAQYRLIIRKLETAIALMQA